MRVYNFKNRIQVVLFFICSLGFSIDKGLKEYNNNNFQEAREYYESVIEKKSDDQAAHFGLGVSAYRQGDMQSAMEAFDEIIRNNTPELKAESYYNMGNILYEQQMTEESMTLYKKALMINPNDSDAKFNYEMLKYQLQNKEQSQGENDDQKENNKQENSEQSKQNEQEKEEKKENSDQQSNQNQQNEEDLENPKNEQESNQQESEQEDQKNQQHQEQMRESEQENAKEENQDRLNAQAILDALKDEEKINKKRQIARMKSKKLEKDW